MVYPKVARGARVTKKRNVAVHVFTNIQKHAVTRSALSFAPSEQTRSISQMLQEHKQRRRMVHHRHPQLVLDHKQIHQHLLNNTTNNQCTSHTMTLMLKGSSASTCRATMIRPMSTEAPARILAWTNMRVHSRTTLTWYLYLLSCTPRG